MRIEAVSVADYLSALPEDRRAALSAVRATIRSNLPPGYEEGMQYSMIGYFVPHSRYPAGYHCDPRQPLPFASLASQKNHMALYMFCLYTNPDYQAWFRQAWTNAGKRLDMGKSCVRFRTIDDVPLDVVGQAIRRVPVRALIEQYEAILAGSGRKRPRASAAAKKTAAKKPPARKSAAKKRAAGKPSPRRAAKKTSSKRSGR